MSLILRQHFDHIKDRHRRGDAKAPDSDFCESHGYKSLIKMVFDRILEAILTIATISITAKMTPAQNTESI